MDNHRLALWCWVQKIDKTKSYNLIHIDTHPDMSESALNYFKYDLFTISLQGSIVKPVSATHHLRSSKEIKAYDEVKYFRGDFSGERYVN